nr:hypothetical protein [Tanacetum cinerariifolium]
MEIDIEEDKNELEFTYPYEEVDHLKPPPPASESKPDDEIEVKNPIEHEDKTIPASVHEVVRDHEFYQKMIHRGFMFEERPNEVINIPIEDEKSLSSKPRESPRDP